MPHYYTLEGSPRYTITGSNGKERSVTLRDARKLGLVPGVTEIFKLLDKPQLAKYYFERLVQATLEADKQKETESFDDYLQRLIEITKEHSERAKNRGSYLHTKLEEVFNSKTKFEDLKLEDKIFIKPVLEYLRSTYGEQNWESEVCFGSPIGYGGTVDLVCRSSRIPIIIDFKVKDGEDPSKFYCYDEHIMQLSAYREGLKLIDAECSNLYISGSRPGVLLEVKHDKDTIDTAYMKFKCLLKYWQLKNNHFLTSAHDYA